MSSWRGTHQLPRSVGANGGERHVQRRELIAVEPKGGKWSRASAAQPIVEAGHVYLPRPMTLADHPIPARAWVADFIEALAVFPYGEHDDDVDAFSQLVARCQGACDGFFEYVRDAYERAHTRPVGPAPADPPPLPGYVSGRSSRMTTTTARVCQGGRSTRAVAQFDRAPAF
jgi:terminase large subunit-like protein